MDDGGPSRTALATARARAYHQIADQPRILTDPLAARLLDVTADELAGSDPPDRPRRLFFAARARFAEDCVAAAVASGVSQVVILGAGLDTFAYRNPTRICACSRSTIPLPKRGNGSVSPLPGSTARRP